MSKILKKISASFLLILMIFSVAFNIISYAAGVNNTETIISGKFKLELSNDLYLQMTDQEWQSWLSNYNTYYNYLSSFTGCDPLSETGNSYITIDATSDNVSSYAYYHTYENGKWDCTIFIRKSILETEINKIKNNIGRSDSYTLIHELGHAFQYKYNTQGANTKNWCFQGEVMTMIEAAYVQQMSGISTLYYANLATFNDCKTAYINQMYGMDSKYNNYYWLAGKLLTLKDSSSLSAFSSIINSGKVSGSTANRFNSFIDTWEEITGEDIWSNFSQSDISTIESILGGTIGTLKELETKVTSISVKGDKSKTEGTIDYTQDDTKATIAVTVESKKQPQSVTIKLGDKEQTITSPTINGNTYVYTTIVDVSTLTTQDKLEADSNVYVTVTDANGKKTDTYKKELKIESEELAVEIKSISIKGDITQEINKIDLDADTKLKVEVQIEIIPIKDIDEVKLSIGNKTYTLKNPTTLDNVKIYNNNLTLTDEIKSGIENNPEVTITAIINKKEMDKKSYTLTLKSVEDPYIDEIIFQQKNNKNEGIFDEALTKESDENYTATLTVSIANISKEEAVAIKESLIISDFKGFKQSNVTLKNYDSDTKTATYEIEVTYEGLILGDLEEEKYVNCEIQAIVNEETLTKTIQIEVQNVEEEEKEYKYYYGQISEADSKIHYTEFEVKDEITIEGENEAIVYIKIVGEDISEKHLVIENTTYDKTGKYVNGGTRYGITFHQSGTYKAILDGKEIATIKVTINSNPEIKYVYVFDVNKNGINTVTDNNANKATTDRQNPENEIGTNSTEVNWIIADLNEKDSNGEELKYYCYNANKGLKFSSSEGFAASHYYEYKSKENIKLDDNDLLILAFLQKVSEKEAKSINGGTLPPNWRANAIQYYIWNEITNKGNNIGYGNLNTLIKSLKTNQNGNNDYIDFENKTITLDGKTYKIKDYTAVTYTVKGIYRSSDGSVYLEYEDDEEDLYRQPLITFDVELEEGPGIQLSKVDEEGNPLEATFEVYESKKTENDIAWYKLDEYTTDKETGLTEVISTKAETKYAIFETKAPEGYKPTKQYAIIEVDAEGNCTYKIYEAPKESIDKNGYINLTKIADGEEYLLANDNFIEDGTEVTEDIDWNAGEVKEDGDVELQLILTNKYDMPPLKIIKVDQDKRRIGGKGGTFEITITSKDGNGNITKTELLDENGEINISLVEEKITGTELEITIKEINPPDGYEAPETAEYTFKIKYSEEKEEWEIVESLEDDLFKVSIENSIIQAQITNIKKKDLELQILKVDDTNLPLSGVGFTVSCSGLQGLSGSLVTGEDGKTQTLKAKKENIKPGTYTVTINETNRPEGYKPLEEVSFPIIVKEDGSIVVGNTPNSLVSISTTSTDDVYTISVTIQNKKEDEKEPKPQKSEVQIPLIMTISGRVWLDQPQGKNSETNGFYDDGEELEGITVKIYEEDGVTPAKFADKNLASSAINSGLASNYLGEYKRNIEYKINMITDSYKTETDALGNFVFSGLDPDRYYTVVFEYNGMRYSEIKASINIEGCGTPETVAATTTAPAVEDAGRRAAITEMFKEIGPYPNNYSGGLVFTQTEVEQYIQNKTIPTGATVADMEKFIENTKITAKIENLGGILRACEGKLRSHNSGLDPQTKGDFIFPVVEKKEEPKFYYPKAEAIENLNQYIKSNFMPQYKKGTKWIGYKVNAHVCYEEWEEIYWSGHPSHQQTSRNIYNHKTKDYEDCEHILKDYIKKLNIPNPDRLETCSVIETYTDPKGETHSFMCRHPLHSISTTECDEHSYLQVINYYVKEGYSTGVEEDDIHHTRISTWDTANEPLYDTDKIKGGSGEITGKWGWEDKLTGVDDNELDGVAKEGLGKLIELLDSEINKQSPSSPFTDLCVVYMPTVDLGLYDDVQKAVVTINGQEEKYIYDKRVANGTIFQFGVNEYDIQNSRNVKGDVEEAYADYYQSLTDGNPDGGKSTVTQEPYEDIGIRKEDVNINIIGNESNTTNGSAIAGYYNDYDVSIEMVYRIKIYNQAAVSAHVTSIWDYYMDTFEFDGVYSDAECTKPMNVSVTDATSIQVEGYKVKEIQLNSIELKGNDSYEIFVKLHMTNPKATLGGDVLDAGYPTWNYAEISGYGTKIGVIDIDSCPGDLRPEERFLNGPYDDDEGKSPTLIFKNPENASRKISGVMFEDGTGKTEIKSYVGETREGDGNYSGEQDKPIAGATVQLIEVTEEGTPLNSPNNPEIGLRAQTLTKDDGTYEFDKVVASNYIVRFKYGNNYETVLTQLQGYKNQNSYNGESYENTKRDTSLSGEYWYTNAKEGSSYIEDNKERRTIVTNNFVELTNEKAEILNSWKDTNPNMSLVDQLIERAHMYSETERMLLDVEYHPRYENKIVETEGNGRYEKTYIMGNINGGIVERERAELQITKTVKEISIVDSAGKEITGGKAGEDIKYVKWIQGPGGFVDMEIDSELLSGAILKITYEITVANNSEFGNNINNIQVIDYVSNNLNYDASYGNNAKHNWSAITTEDIAKFVNNTSLNASNDKIENKIDLSTYQTILMTTFNGAGTKTLTLEKNLSSEEDSNFNYENQVEIVRSYNPTGRGDYSSIYGNLDPTTYTSRQGNLKWDEVTESTNRGFPQELTDKTVIESGAKINNPNAIRLAEKDSGNAEEVVITPPTGAKGIVFETQHYILAIIGLISLAGAVILIKKYMQMTKE